jgi:hypothetical protein
MPKYSFVRQKMNKVVRIIALIMAILMGLSAIGMIAMYVAAEGYDGISSSLAASVAEAGEYLNIIAECSNITYSAAMPV